MRTRISKGMTVAAAILGLLASSAINAGLPTQASAVADRLSKQALESDPGLEYAPQRVLVRFRKGTPPGLMAGARGIVGTSARHHMKIVPGLERLDIGMDVPQAVAYLRGLPFVEFAEPDYVLQAVKVPNDVSFEQEWGLNNTGQSVNGSSGTAGADINMPEAWDSTTGNGSTVIAVIDTGVQWNHPDLNANIWSNADEIPGNGIDDDNNGYTDDVRGWDFYSDNNNPMDYNGHGTHVAGTICAEGDNGEGVAGVLWDCRIMPLRFIGANGGYTSDAVQAISYAVANGAKVSSNSWGSYSFSLSLYNAISNAAANDHIFVAAAGNEGYDNGETPFYPASYNADNIISVAATDNRDSLASWSNHGISTVDVGAPGVNIYSTYKGSSYRFLSGTSMATPHAAGLVGLVQEQNPDWGYQQVISHILGAARTVPGLLGKTASGGIINAEAALVAGQIPLPAQGDECGAPAYSKGSEAHVFLWKDCDGSQRWHLRATAGGSPSVISYAGTVTADAAFVDVSPYSLEGGDKLDYTSSPKRIDYKLNMLKKGEDGFNFTVPASAAACFDATTLPGGARVLLGQARMAVTPPFNLDTLETCGTPPPGDCGPPAYDSSTDNAIVLWKDCSSDRWHLIAMAGSRGFNRYSGSLLADQDFTGVTTESLESNDVADNTPKSRIVFDLRMSSPWYDGIHFTIPCSATVLFDASGTGGTNILVGPGRTPVTAPFNLTDYGGCAP
jgi:subtilisin family serine protease